MTDEKQAIRERALKYRDAIEPHPDWADDAADTFFNIVKEPQGLNIALYFPIGNELDTLPLADKLWEAGAVCLLPVFNQAERQMRFARWEKNAALLNGPFGVPMPSEPEFIVPDVVVVPLVAFDQKGNRMGHGQGYYDATLEDLRAQQEILVIGWAYAEQAVLMKLPTEDHDQKLDLVITPQRVFDFRN